MDSKSNYGPNSTSNAAIDGMCGKAVDVSVDNSLLTRLDAIDELFAAPRVRIFKQA